MKVSILHRIQRDLTVPGSYYEPGEAAELDLPAETLSALIDAGIVSPVTGETPKEPAGEPAGAGGSKQIILEDGVDDSEATLAGKALQKRSYPRGGFRHG